MNNYYNFKNYQNNNYQNNELYDPYEGFIRGNLFKNLYSPYTTKEPYEIKPMNEQAKLLTYINELCFALTDINLYLDIFSNDQNMINLFNQYKAEKDKIINEYESKFGPLELSSNYLNSYPWVWDNMPWPWDN